MKIISLILLMVLGMVLLALNVNAVITTINFKNPYNETLFDARVSSDVPITVIDDADLFWGGVSTSKKFFIMWALNTSIFPSSSTLIYEAYVSFVSSTVEIADIANIYEVNETWDNSTLTYTIHPCNNFGELPAGFGNIDLTKCNATNMSSVKVSTSGLSVSLNVTKSIARAVREGRKNISFWINSTSDSGANNNAFYSSKISNAEANRPSLNITFDSDILPPKINSTFNTTVLNQGTMVNMSANISDDTGLSFCQFLINDTPSGAYLIYNYSALSGTGDKCSQNFSITPASGLLNFTVRVNDTSNNKNQSEYLLAVTDTISPELKSWNFSKFSIVDGGRLNLTINTSDSSSNLQTINFNFSNPNNVKFQRLNPTHFSLPTTKDYILNYTLFSGSETSVVGKWNLTYLSVADLSGNIVEDYPNITFEVTAIADGGGSSGSSGGGGGGGGSITNIEQITIIGNLSIEIKPPILNRYFLYTSFKGLNQTFKSTHTLNKDIDKCISSKFKCSIGNATITLTLSYNNDSAFISKISDKVILLDKASLAKTINAEVRFINLAYAVPISIDVASTNHAIFRLGQYVNAAERQIVGIRLWFVIALAAAASLIAYLYSKEATK